MTSVAWRNLTLAGDGPIVLIGLRGWLDNPDIAASDMDRPGRHGQYPGSMFARGRTIEADFEILADQDANTDALMAAVAPSENPVEETLTVTLADGQVQMASARLVRWSLPTDQRYFRGLQRRGTLQWKATDPRRYSAMLHSVSTGLPSPAMSGVPFPLAFPLAFGDGQAGGQVVVLNAGAAATWPLMVISGPVVGPRIVDMDSGARLAFVDDFEILAGQQLVIDTDNRTVLIGGTVSRRNAMVAADWFPLPPGQPRRIGFRAAAYSPMARLDVQWRDAWL